MPNTIAIPLPGAVAHSVAVAHAVAGAAPAAPVVAGCQTLRGSCLAPVRSSRVGRCVALLVLAGGAASAAVASDSVIKFTEPNGERFSLFGSSVALDDGVALVSAEGQEPGAAYLFNAETGALRHTLTRPAGVGSDASFGPVALSGGLALVGAPDEEIDGRRVGAAYLFDVASGSLLNTFTAPPDSSPLSFGGSVALDGVHALIGDADGTSVYGQTGVAHLFDIGSGDLLHSLAPPFDPSDPASAVPSQIGGSVAIDGGVAVVSFQTSPVIGPGSTFIPGQDFVHLFDAATGSPLRALPALDLGGFNAQHGQIDIDRGTVILGAPFQDGRDRDVGAASVFDAETGSSIGTLTAFDGLARDEFGWSVALDDGTALVGAPGNSATAFDSGGAYLLDVGTGFPLAKLTVPDGARSDRFGDAVAFDGDRVLIGAPWDDDNGDRSGSAYLIELNFDADANGDGFVDAADYTVIRDTVSRVEAVDVVLDGRPDERDYAVWADFFGTGPDSRPGVFPPGDFNLDGFVDAADYTLWRDAATGYLVADSNGDGGVDAFDYVVWINRFGDSAGVAAGSATGGALVPEPAGVTLLACAATVVARRRSRRGGGAGR
ncbi:MAG: hypothetical protein AAF805_12140 [Planctomycetota bacterium]